MYRHRLRLLARTHRQRSSSWMHGFVLHCIAGRLLAVLVTEDLVAGLAALERQVVAL